MRLIGIDIGGTKTTVAEGTAQGRILSREVFPTIGPEATIDAIASNVSVLRPDPNTVIGIACGDPQESAAGVILAAAGGNSGPCVARSWMDSCSCAPRAY